MINSRAHPNSPAQSDPVLSDLLIREYPARRRARNRRAVVASVGPVFASLEQALGKEIFRRVHGGWRYQASAVRQVLADDDIHVWVAEAERDVMAFVAAKMHCDRLIGEISMLAVQVGTSSYLWRHVIGDLQHERRCVAVDLPLHGRTPPAPNHDFSLTAIAGFVADFCEALELDRIDLLDVEPMLWSMNVPTLVVWGTGDIFFKLKWAHWLRDTIPGVTEAVEVDGGRLFFPDERANELVPQLRRLWNAHSGGAPSRNSRIPDMTERADAAAEPSRGGS